METKKYEFANLNEEQEKEYLEQKANVFETREQTESKLNTLKNWLKNSLEEKEFFEMLLSKEDEDIKKYNSKLTKGLENLESNIKKAEGVIKEVQTILDGLNEIVEKYFTETIEEGKMIVNKTTIEFLKIASKIVRLE